MAVLSLSRADRNGTSARSGVAAFSTREDKLDMQIKIIYMQGISIRGRVARI